MNKKKTVVDTVDITSLIGLNKSTPPSLDDFIRDLQAVGKTLRQNGANSIGVSFDVAPDGLDIKAYAHATRAETEEEYRHRTTQSELKNLLKEKERVGKLMKAAKQLVDLDPQSGVSLSSYTGQMKRIRERIGEIKEERKK